MTIFRRTLLIYLWMFWQGGFLFYGTIVVTIGSRELGSDFAQGMITRHVTLAINITGIVTLLAWLWDLLCESKFQIRRRWAIWVLMAISIGVLWWLRASMELHIDTETGRLIERAHFRQMHRWYLRISTVQLIEAILFTVWTLQNWRWSDNAIRT